MRRADAFLDSEPDLTIPLDRAISDELGGTPWFAEQDFRQAADWRAAIEAREEAARLGAEAPMPDITVDGESALAALREGRDMTQRIKKAEAIDEATYKGINRAATSGTGGNEINTIRQNIRAILDNPKARRGYSADEIKAMEEIVRGTPTINAARWFGRFSPTSGMLSATLGGGLGAGAISTGNVLMAIPPAAGYIAKAAGERMTKSQVENLAEIIRNGGVAPAGKTLSEAEKAVIRAMMLRQGEASLSPQP